MYTDDGYTTSLVREPVLDRRSLLARPEVFGVINYPPQQTQNEVALIIPPKSLNIDKLVINKIGINDYISSNVFVAGSSGWRIHGNGDAEFNNVVVRGDVTATTGRIGDWSITTDGIYYDGTGTPYIKTAATVEVGSTGVIFDKDGIRGYDSVLGNTFNLPTDGSAPTFSSGIINSTIFEINTNAVLRTSDTVGDGTVNSAGVLINNTGFYACGVSQTPATANVKILATGSATFSGTVTAVAGAIGGWTLGTNSLTTGSGATTVGLDNTVTAGDDVRIYAGSTTKTSAPFRVTEAGVLTATNATITGTVNANAGAFTGSLTLGDGSSSSGVLTLSIADTKGDCYIGAGKTDFTNVQTGFILGLDDSDSNKAKFYIGSSTKYLNWNGSDVSVVGGTITGGTIQTASSGQRVVLNSAGVSFYPPSGSDSIGYINNSSDPNSSIFSARVFSNQRALSIWNLSTSAVSMPLTWIMNETTNADFTGAELDIVRHMTSTDDTARTSSGSLALLTRCGVDRTPPVTESKTGSLSLTAYTGVFGYQSISVVNYKVQIDGDGGPNTFKWSDDGGSTWDATGVEITEDGIELNNGVMVGFDNLTGGVIGDYYTFTMRPNTSSGYVLDLANYDTTAVVMRITSADDDPMFPGRRIDIEGNKGNWYAFSNGGIEGKEIRASGDLGGLTSKNCLTNVSDLTANSTGVGTIKFKGTTARDSSGFIKIYIGTTAYYIPVFSAITG